MGVNVEVLALLTTTLLALSAAFQIGLAVGEPSGAVAYGGRVVADDGTLPG